MNVMVRQWIKGLRRSLTTIKLVLWSISSRSMNYWYKISYESYAKWGNWSRVVDMLWASIELSQYRPSSSQRTSEYNALTSRRYTVLNWDLCMRSSQVGSEYLDWDGLPPLSCRHPYYSRRVFVSRAVWRKVSIVVLLPKIEPCLFRGFITNAPPDFWNDEHSISRWSALWIMLLSGNAH